RDLPARNEKYDGDHITVKRIALTRDQLRGLPSFPATDKRKDPRYKWFVANYGKRCWEIDALDPKELRDLVQRHIRACIVDDDTWERCVKVNRAERRSLREFRDAWRGALRP